jgi:hypothetical protein
MKKKKKRKGVFSTKKNLGMSRVDDIPVDEEEWMTDPRDYGLHVLAGRTGAEKARELRQIINNDPRSQLPPIKLSFGTPHPRHRLTTTVERNTIPVTAFISPLVVVLFAGGDYRHAFGPDTIMRSIRVAGHRAERLETDMSAPFAANLQHLESALRFAVAFAGKEARSDAAFMAALALAAEACGRKKAPLIILDASTDGHAELFQGMSAETMVIRWHAQRPVCELQAELLERLQ